jgi:cell shape-determining protein MreD
MMVAGECMKRTGTARVLAAIFIGAVFGLYRHYQQVRALGLGREGYLAEQSHYFDRITKLHSAGLTLVAGVILASVAVGLYELIAAGITRVLPQNTVEE